MNLTAKQQLSRNPSNAGYSTPLKTYSIPATSNEDGTINVPAQPVYLIDPTREPIPANNNVSISDPTTTAVGRVSSGVDGQLGFSNPAVWTNAIQQVAASSGINQYVRTPDVFKHALCTTAAATALWTPAGGKKFRLMGYVICPDAGLAAAGIQLITFLDQAAAITIAHQTYLPIAASIAHQVPIVVTLGPNGYRSAVADNVLNVTMTSNVTAGAVSIMAYGTEE